MPTNAEEFNRELDEFVATIPEDTVGPVVRAVALEGLARLIAKTPVDTGYARAGWQVSIGAPSTSQPAHLDETTRDVGDVKAGSSTYQAGRAVIEAQVKQDPFVDIWLGNNVEYIEVLEDGRVEGGFHPLETPYGEVTGPKRSGARGSIQAPNGMLAITFEELTEQFEVIAGSEAA
jgi:hypothetical protein